MEILMESFRAQLDGALALVPRVGYGVIVIAVAMIVGRVLRRTVLKVLSRSDRTRRHARVFAGATSLGVTLLGLLMAMHAVGLGRLAASLLATGGVMAIVLGFAFREIGENLLAGVFLAVDRTFDVGDTIENGGITGVVRGIDLRHVHVRTPDGCDVFIPSSQILGNPLRNYTRDGLRRAEFTVGIDYGDDPRAAQDVLYGVLPSVEGVIADPAPEVHLAAFQPTFVELQVFVWVDAFSKGPGLTAVRTRAMELCRTTLRDGGFTFSSDAATAVALRPVEVTLAGRATTD